MCEGFYKFVRFRFEHVEPITIPTGGVDMFDHYRNEKLSSHQIYIQVMLGHKTGEVTSNGFQDQKSFDFSLA